MMTYQRGRCFGHGRQETHISLSGAQNNELDGALENHGSDHRNKAIERQIDRPALLTSTVDHPVIVKHLLDQPLSVFEVGQGAQIGKRLAQPSASISSAGFHQRFPRPRRNNNDIGFPARPIIQRGCPTDSDEATGDQHIPCRGTCPDQ